MAIKELSWGSIVQIRFGVGDNRGSVLESWECQQCPWGSVPLDSGWSQVAEFSGHPKCLGKNLGGGIGNGGRRQSPEGRRRQVRMQTCPGSVRASREQGWQGGERLDDLRVGCAIGTAKDIRRRRDFLGQSQGRFCTCRGGGGEGASRGHCSGSWRMGWEASAQEW